MTVKEADIPQELAQALLHSPHLNYIPEALSVGVNV
jgi:hypothetical protein